MRRIFTGLIAISVAAVATAALAQEFVTKTKRGNFDDVRFELGNVIVERGLATHSEGNIEAMLRRTGADVGSSKAVYKNAQFVQFCSALLSRRLMELDPMTMGYCPYGVFIYETIAQPGDIVVGYRRLAVEKSRNADVEAAKAAVETLLAGIVADAVK